MKKTIMIFLTLIMILVLIGCNKSSDEDTRKNESTSKSGITTKESSSNIDVTDNSEKLENSEVVDEITNENEALEPVVLTEEQKNKLVKLYMKSNFYFCASEDIDVPIPLELRITEKIDEYDSVCYSVYEYGNDKFYAFLFREKYDPKKSVFYSSKTVYEKFFLIPMDKIYTMDDFKDIEINKSDLSDIKKIYKYADTQLNQFIKSDNSRKKYFIEILSKEGEITIYFKKYGDKYIVTKITDDEKDGCVSKIADIDKNFN